MEVMDSFSQRREELEELITVELELEPEADFSSDIVPDKGEAATHQQNKDNQSNRSNQPTDRSIMSTITPH